MSKKSCPNTRSSEWIALVKELNDNRLLAMKAFWDNGNEIPNTDSEVVQKLKPKSKLNLGPEIETVLKDENDNWSEEDFYKIKGTDKTINRVGSLTKNFSHLEIPKGKTYVEIKADNLWKGKDHSEKIMSDEKIPETYDEYLERRIKYTRMAAAKGKIIHYAIEAVLNPNKLEENQQKIIDIEKDFKNLSGEQEIYWEWIVKTEQRENSQGETETYYPTIEKIFNNLGINVFKDVKDSFDDVTKDMISTEVSVAVPEINIAGTIDLMAQHADGRYTLVDWKTGKNFSGNPSIEDAFLMKYGDQGTKEVTDNFRNRGKLQLMIYAMLLKANNPGMKFRGLQVAWIPNEFIIQAKDVDAFVDVSSFLPMIEEFFSDKKLLKQYGIDPKIKDKLLAKDKNIFNPNHYSQVVNDDVMSEIYGKGKNPELVLQNKIEELRYITMRNKDFDKLTRKDRIRAMELSTEITDMMNEGNVIMTHAAYHDMNLMERYLGNYSEANHPEMVAWKKFKNKREDIAREIAHSKIKKFRSLLRPVMKQIEAEQNIHGIAGQKEMDYDKVYGWMYVEESISDEVDVTKEHLLTNSETDPELKDRFRKLSPEKKRLLNYVNQTFGEYFNGENSLMNKTAVSDNDGNRISFLDLFNKKKSKLDQRKYEKGFFFKVPISNEEIIYREGNGSYFKGLFKKSSLQRMFYNAATQFREKEFENWFDDNMAMPLKYMGNHYIDSSKNYTRNMETIFAKAVTELERTDQLNDVYALGTALQYKFKYGDPNSENPVLYTRLSEFLDAKLIHDVQKRSKPISYLRTKKVRIPMLTNNGVKPIPVSLDQVLMGFRSWGSAITMWAKPFQGTGNALHATILTHREGLKGTLIKKLKFLNIGSGIADFSAKTIAKADAEYTKRFLPDAIKGNIRKNKMYLLAKKMDYFGNNFDFSHFDREMISKRMKNMNQDILYAPYSIPEEFVSMTTMAAQLMHIKNPKTGKSLWESYEVFEIEDENGKGTGEYDVRWVGGVRGSVKKGDGPTVIYEEITDLTSEEIAHLKKVHERLQGGYRREEALAIEVSAFGKLFVQLKKYFPRIILNAVQRKRLEPDLGQYKEVVDENGKTVMRKTSTGEEMPVYEWHARVTEGRWLTLGKYFVDILQFKPDAWSKLADEQKANLVEAALVLGTWMVNYGAWLAMFGDTDDDDTNKKLWKQYLVDNLTQQYNPIDIARTIKTFGTPVSVSRAMDFVMNGAQLTFSSANYALGNDDLALTKNGDLRGWNQFAKTIPGVASVKDIVSKIENSKSIDTGVFDWMYSGVR